MNAFTFTPASRESAKARIGLQGPAGCGKTKTALRLAEGLANGGPIGVVDTERGSALKYAPVPGRPELGGHEFGHMPMDTHDPRHLIQAVKVAEEAGIAVLIVDSWSHYWNGRGGLLEIVEQAGAQKGAGGTFGGWRTGNPIEQDMLDALLNFCGHLIVTMRTKGDYVIEGKKVTKVGVKAVQREGAEYELDVVMDMVEGTATVTKTRYEPLEGLTIHHPGPDVAETILEQLGQGVDPVTAIVDAIMADDLTYEGALQQHANAKRRNLLTAPVMHPKTGAPTTVGELIAERGKAVKPAAPEGQQAPQPARDNRVYRQTDEARAADQAPEQQDPSQVGASTAESGTRAEAATDRATAAPEPPATGTPAATSGEAATAPQMRMMHAAFNDLGISDRAARLDATSLIIHRQIGTANELTKAEAARLLEILGSFADLETALADFADYLDELAREAEKSAADGAGGAAAPPSGASSDEYAAAADAA